MLLDIGVKGDLTNMTNEQLEHLRAYIKERIIDNYNSMSKDKSDMDLAIAFGQSYGLLFCFEALPAESVDILLRDSKEIEQAEFEMFKRLIRG